MAKYSLKQVGTSFVVMQSGRAVTTPGGYEFSSTDERLAKLLCDDLNQFGSQPTKSASYVGLHASYLDMGRRVPKKVLADNILVGYTTDWDLILQVLDTFESEISSPAPTESAGIMLDPMMYFGPREDIAQIDSWLQGLSRRALSAAQVCGGSFRSILLAYRVLVGNPQIPVGQLAAGIVKYSDWIPSSLEVEGEPETTSKNVSVFLDKVCWYASLPDEAA